LIAINGRVQGDGDAIGNNPITASGWFVGKRQAVPWAKSLLREENIDYFAYTGFSMSPSTQVSIERIPGKSPDVVIFRIVGSITLGGAHIVRNAFRSGELPGHTIIDFSEVPYVDSAGMSEIISHEIYCRDHGARLTLANVNDRVKSMFRITRLHEVLHIVDTVKQAEAS
jgi:anti-sigma B factor antagonist